MLLGYLLSIISLVSTLCICYFYFRWNRIEFFLNKREKLNSVVSGISSYWKHESKTRKPGYENSISSVLSPGARIPTAKISITTLRYSWGSVNLDYWHRGKWSVFFFLEFKSSSEDWNSPVIKLRIMYIASATSMSLKLKPGKSFFFMFYLSIYLGLCWVFVAALRASSGCDKWGLLSSCDVRASHCGCFSLQNTGSRAHGLQ